MKRTLNDGNELAEGEGSCSNRLSKKKQKQANRVQQLVNSKELLAKVRLHLRAFHHLKDSQEVRELMKGCLMVCQIKENQNAVIIDEVGEVSADAEAVHLKHCGDVLVRDAKPVNLVTEEHFRQWAANLVKWGEQMPSYGVMLARMNAVDHLCAKLNKAEKRSRRNANDCQQLVNSKELLAKVRLHLRAFHHLKDSQEVRELMKGCLMVCQIKENQNAVIIDEVGEVSADSEAIHFKHCGDVLARDAKPVNLVTEEHFRQWAANLVKWGEQMPSYGVMLAKMHEVDHLCGKLNKTVWRERDQLYDSVIGQQGSSRIVVAPNQLRELQMLGDQRLRQVAIGLLVRFLVPDATADENNKRKKLCMGKVQMVSWKQADAPFVVGGQHMTTESQFHLAAPYTGPPISIQQMELDGDQIGEAFAQPEHWINYCIPAPTIDHIGMKQKQLHDALQQIGTQKYRAGRHLRYGKPNKQNKGNWKKGNH